MKTGLAEKMFDALYDALLKDRRSLCWRMTPATISDLRFNITNEMCVFSAPLNRFEFSGLPIEITDDVSDWELKTEQED